LMILKKSVLGFTAINQVKKNKKTIFFKKKKTKNNKMREDNTKTLKTSFS